MNAVAKITPRAQLKCSIVDRQFIYSSPDLTYVVEDENGIVVAEGVSSSEGWVRHDAGGYHTKKRFDEMFPNGWDVTFDF